MASYTVYTHFNCSQNEVQSLNDLCLLHFSPESQLKQSRTLSNIILWSRFTVFIRFISSTLMKGIPVMLVNLSPNGIPSCYIRLKVQTWLLFNAGKINPNKSNQSPSAACAWLQNISQLVPGSSVTYSFHRVLWTMTLNPCNFREGMFCFIKWLS